jgi:thiaminase
MPQPAFDTWLAQDYRFVTDLLRFQSRLLGRAHRPAQSVLAAGAAALADELTWFEAQAETRGLNLAASPLPATVAYAGLLERLDASKFPVDGPFVDGTFVEGTFVEGTFVEGTFVEGTFVEGTFVEGTFVDAAFVEVVEAEVRFWDMAWERAA